MKKFLLCVLTFILILLTIFTYGCLNLNSLPEGELVNSYYSPEKSNKINIYLCNGGATTDFAIRGELEKSDGEKKNIYWQYHCNSADVEWISEETVIINGQKLNIYTDVYDYRQYKIKS